MRMPELESERLIVRPFALDDVEAAVRIMDAGREDEDGVRAERRSWLEWTVRSYEELARLFQPPYGDRAVVLKATGEVVGACGLVPLLAPLGLLPSFQRESGDDRRLFGAEVGLFYAIAPEHRGRGYATEAARALVEYGFRDLRLRRILATTEYENAGSQGVMRRLGMVIDRNPGTGPEWFQVVGHLRNGMALG